MSFHAPPILDTGDRLRYLARVSDLPKTRELILLIRASDLVLAREGAIAITALETAERMHHVAIQNGFMAAPEMRAWIGGEWLKAKVWAGIVGGETQWIAVSAELLPYA